MDSILQTCAQLIKNLQERDAGVPRVQKIMLAEAEKQVHHEQVDTLGLLMIASALTCALVGGVFFSRQYPVQVFWLVSAMALYVLGSVGVTIAFNVPRNNKLAKLSADSPEAITYWPVFLREWLDWNHLRCICSLLAAVARAACSQPTRLDR